MVWWFMNKKTQRRKDKPGHSKTRQKHNKYKVKKQYAKYVSIKNVAHSKGQKGGKRPCIVANLINHEGLGNKLGIFGAALIVKEKVNLPICIMGTATPHSSRDYASLFDAEPVPWPMDINNMKDVMKSRVNDTSAFSKNTLDYTNANVGKNIKITSILYQHYKSHLPIVPKMKEMLMRREFNKEQYKPYKIPSEMATAFIHVRQGDYKNLSWEQPDTYYINALTKLNELDTDNAIETILVFSDNISWCETQMDKWRKIAPKKKIETKEGDELQTLYMMMQCKAGAIISGSTFSAWGAMLGANENPKSIILYPKNIRQFHGATNPMSFPDRWQYISD
jgi:hypothetical protein